MRYDSARLSDFSHSASRKRRRSCDGSLLLLVLLLLGIGLVMVLSSSYARAYYDPAGVTGGDPLYYFVRQLIFALLGLGAMFVASCIPMQVYRRYSLHFLCFVLLLLVLVPFVGVKANGARRWLGVGGLTVQPSELAKLAVVLSFSFLICKFRTGRNHFRYGIIPFAVLLVLIVALLVLEPHFSASVIIVAIGGIMLFLGGWKLGWFIAADPCGRQSSLQI